MKIVDRMSIGPDAKPRPRRSVGTSVPLHTLGAEPPEFLVVLDVFSLIAAFYLAYAIAPGLKSRLLSTTSSTFRAWLSELSPQIGGEFRSANELIWVLLVMVVVTVLAVQAIGGYRPLLRQSRTRVVMAAMAAPVLSMSAITLILFATRSTSYSRLFLSLLTLFSIVELGAYRLLLRWYRLKRIASGFYARNIILIGSTRALGWLSAHVVENTSPHEYTLAGYLNVSSSQLPVTYEAGGESFVLPCLGDVNQLGALLVHRPIHEVIAIQGDATDWLAQVVEECDYFRITLRIVPEALVFGQLRDLQLIYHSDPLRLPEIVLRPRHVDSAALFVKRLMDIVISAALLIVLSPLLVLIAIAIKVTTPRLSVLYRWNVVGYNGRPFTGFKFTTMAEDADRRRDELVADNEMQGPVFKIRRDPRVTPLGRILRKFSLNELPQLWSVLKGDMSLVGPRPAFPHELERYQLWQKRKLSVRPGITCLWQVRGRNQISRFDEWVRMDFEYIDNWSLWLDVKILAKTAWTVVRGSGW
jgi:exopolysaccharide biosynthesis polyprenyl glycosylphosphotransferase